MGRRGCAVDRWRQNRFGEGEDEGEEMKGLGAQLALARRRINESEPPKSKPRGGKGVEIKQPRGE